MCLLMSRDGYKAQSGMDCEDYKVLIGFSEKAYNIFLDFMTRVAEFEELVTIGGRFLSTYKSELVNMCQQGIHEHVVKAKALLDELGCLMENVLVLVKEEIEKLSHYMDELQDDGLVCPLIRVEEEPENINQYHQNTSVSECATMMQALYGMLEDDYVMQEKIVSSLNLATPLEALGSYCFMWDLRPFVDDDIIKAAWRHVK